MNIYTLYITTTSPFQIDIDNNTATQYQEDTILNHKCWGLQTALDWWNSDPQWVPVNCIWVHNIVKMSPSSSWDATSKNPSAQHCAQASRQTTPAGLVKGRALCREDIFQSFLLPDAILNHIALKHRQSWWDINYLKNKYYRVLLWMLHDAAYFLSSHFPNQFCYIPIPVQSQPPSLPTFSPVLH